MTPQVILEKLRGLLRTMPPLEGRGQYGEEQYRWLGQARAVMNEWDTHNSVPFNSAAEGLLRNFDRRGNYAVMVAFFHDVIARLENTLRREGDQIFGPGAAYDFFKALNDIVSTAKERLFIVDPYLDAEIFDGYLHPLGQNVFVRLLTAKYVENVRIAAQKFQTQYKRTVEVRKSNAIHDRVIFADNDQCWVLGASIKDAAVKKPTYLAPLSADIATEKRVHYEEIWKAATPI